MTKTKTYYEPMAFPENKPHKRGIYIVFFHGNDSPSTLLWNENKWDWPKNVSSWLKPTELTVSDAVEFAEWLSKKGCVFISHQEEWVNLHATIFNKTTKDLYEQFLNTEK